LKIKFYTMRVYNNYKEVNEDLKLLDLQRKIACEELVGVKNDFAEITKPLAWFQSFAKFASKYGLLLLVKKIFK